MATKLATGQHAVTALRPVQKKGQPWTVSAGRVAAETPEAAQAFAAAIVDSLRAHREREDARAVVIADSNRRIGAQPTRARKLPGSRFAPASIPVCTRVPQRTERGEAYGPVGWTVKDEEKGDYTLRLAILDDVTREPRKPRGIARKVEPVKSAPKARARTVKQPRIVPFVPERAPVPAKVQRGYRPDPCGKCGKTFKTPAGAKWHADNNSDCARYARKGQAA